MGVGIKRKTEGPLHRGFYRPSEKFPGDSNGKGPACSVGDLGSIPVSGRSPGEGDGNPLWYSCLGNFMDRGAWRTTVHGVAKEPDTTKQNNNKNDYVYHS